MLTGITTRTSTPQEDAEQRAGGTRDGGPADGAGSAPAPGPDEVTVTIWHNVAPDDPGRHHIALLDGYRPGDPVVRVFAYQARPGRTAEEIAAEAFDIFNNCPRDEAGAELARAYYGRRLRSLSVGDVVAAAFDGEVRLAVARIGWAPVPGPLTEARTSEHRTRPLPLPGKEDHGE